MNFKTKPHFRDCILSTDFKHIAAIQYHTAPIKKPARTTRTALMQRWGRGPSPLGKGGSGRLTLSLRRSELWCCAWGSAACTSRATPKARTEGPIADADLRNSPSLGHSTGKLRCPSTMPRVAAATARHCPPAPLSHTRFAAILRILAKNY